MIPVRGARVAVVALSAALLVSACGGLNGSRAADPADGASPPSAALPPATSASASASAASAAAAASASGRVAVPDALRFSATTLKGEKFEGASLAGKPVVFWFWAPWCPNCLSEAPAVKATSARFTQVRFVGVAGLDTEAAMKEFVQRTGTGTGTIVHLSDEKGAVWTKLGISRQSTYVFMRPDGVTAKVSGPLDSAELADLVQRLAG
ncbi:TlpA family protein disulfide reductase [Sphaerisporangium rhizosphaerae]|uniref:TlpA family protein disulfide reductase n=1 Tax=Sphaerisporangium rhizosphaerae TaxID=2269375 RepID=A0ABW2PBJ6_9ACTN